MNDQKQLLQDIQIIAFVVKDTQLFLDTHPACESALDYFKYYKNLLTALTEEYEDKFGPLTVYGVDTKDGWSWINEPWPWEKEA